MEAPQISNQTKALAILFASSMKLNQTTATKLFARTQNIKLRQSRFSLEEANKDINRALVASKTSLLFRAGLFLFIMGKKENESINLIEATVDITGMSKKKANVAVRKLKEAGWLRENEAQSG